ncbi:MAG: CPBP family intramembrane metalloprotease [Deltaproteobacteria bacterium]|nr:CPBP family intramembrane metalloprotease [Deltaproteobacteria bacterium]
MSEAESPSSSKSSGKRKPDHLGHLILAAPVFLLYQVGLLISPEAANGVDPLTRSLGYLAGLSWPVYLLIMAVLCAAYGFALRSLARNHALNPRRFPLVIGESLVYALLMGPTANLLLSKVHLVGLPALGGWVERMGYLDRIVASAGAGFYEELVFRLLLFGAIAWLLDQKGLKRWQSVAIAALVSSLLFSAVHYVGPGSDVFALGSFSYRAVLGVFLALIFVFRGFATAVYAHFLYDVYVMCWVL